MNILKKKFETEILRLLSPKIANFLKELTIEEIGSLEEIRLRVNKPIMLLCNNGELFMNVDGEIGSRVPKIPIIPSEEQLLESISLMSENSIYAYSEEIKNCFITLRGGHRVGICGRVIIEKDSIKNLKDISGLNIRISKQILGCSNPLLKFILKDKKDVYNTLIISPPQCGKTTIIRDLSRVLGDGFPEKGFLGIKVGIIDERSEIAACFKGVPQNQVGLRTDVLDGCPKILGMRLMLRSMSPEVIITDEIGGKGDKDSLLEIINAGVRVITTAHGYGLSDQSLRRELWGVIHEKVFERIIVLSNTNGPGTIEQVIDGENLSLLFGRDKNESKDISKYHGHCG